jgi:hypothetical protein
MLRRRWPIAVFALWSAYVWITRIANAWAATSTETTTAKVVSSASAVVLLVGAIAAVAILIRARARAFLGAESLVLRAFAGLTVAVWAFRVPQILLDGDQGVPFKVVHTVLAVISVALAALTWQRAGSEAADTGAPAPAVSPAANAGR